METTRKVLVVDDDERNRVLISDVLKVGGYTCVAASDGLEALEMLRASPPDLIILDLMMPGMDGFEVCRRVKGDPSTRRIPVVVITAFADKASRVKGLESGADDFMSKPFDTSELRVRVKNLLKVKEYEDFLTKYNSLLELRVAEKTREVKESFLDTIQRLTLASEYRDDDTGSHVRRISLYAGHMARALGLADAETEVLYYASPLHDVGKIGVPDSILLKPSALTPLEQKVMEGHTTIGGRILDGSSSAIIRTAKTLALNHHERWDGSGYPLGLKREEIPLGARILNLVDQYDALRSVRPYKPGFSHEKVLSVISRGDGRTLPIHFDPEVLKAFKDTHLRFMEIFDNNSQAAATAA